MTFFSFASSPAKVIMDDHFQSPTRGLMAMSTEQRRHKRRTKRVKNADISAQQQQQDPSIAPSGLDQEDGRFAQLLARNEDELLKFVAKVNRVFEEKLKQPAPFMTFAFCGMQSAGKSTIMERFMNAVLNIVQEGTGTRCPLDCTCIHDASLREPSCELYGEELEAEGYDLTMDQVFQWITEHNQKLGFEDRFSTEPLRLVYRASNVQNMRFVDTPGIISNKSTGKDNREDIKKILSSEMMKPNTKLCVLLEPKEFATNPIIEFCDSSLGGRGNWINNSIFLMTKFDKQLEDSRTAGKANLFFQEFHRNKCFPHLVMTPTLAKENLPPKELFEARCELLGSADRVERERFRAWQNAHEAFREEQGDDLLNRQICERIGFLTAKKKMREIMLEDTIERLPEVVATLRQQLDRCRKEFATLKDKQRFTDPHELKLIVNDMLYYMIQRLESYLNGDLASALNFPHKLQTLDDEVEDEEDSDWSTERLNFHSEKENNWRDRIANMEGEYPPEIQADKKFLGGKQVQRAIEFFRVVMIEALPDPYSLREMVPNGTGYLGGGLQRENWEHAMVQIVKVLMKDVTHPGVNYLVKHIGTIFRRLFKLALEDIKQGEQFSSTFKLVPTAVEKYLTVQFDKMLWNLMKTAADKMHSSLEPMYSTIDPTIPTFYASRFEDEDTSRKDLFVLDDASKSYVKVPSHTEKAEETWKDWMTLRFAAIMTGSGEKAKEFLKIENRNRARIKKSFLPDERTSMITDEESDKILRRSFEYLVALMEFNLVHFRFQVNHYLYMEFKQELTKTFARHGLNADWEALVQPDPSVAVRVIELEGQIDGLKESLEEVQHISHRI